MTALSHRLKKTKDCIVVLVVHAACSLKPEMDKKYCSVETDVLALLWKAQNNIIQT